jgi:hypothetical protein
LKQQFRDIKHDLSNFAHVDFDHESQNEFAWPFDSLKHRLNDFTQVVFEFAMKEDYEF